MTADKYSLENTPTDADHANGYDELLALWKEQQEVSNTGRWRQEPEEFWAWDKKVQALLRPNERAFFLTPYLDKMDPMDPDIACVNRLNHLTKILWYRQGLVTSNGFNG
jgi:hypothetical protein